MRPKTEITDEMVDGAYEYLKPYCTGHYTEGHYRERARGVLEAALNGERRKGDRRALDKAVKVALDSAAMGAPRLVMDEKSKAMRAALDADCVDPRQVDAAVASQGAPEGARKEQVSWHLGNDCWAHHRGGDLRPTEHFHHRSPKQTDHGFFGHGRKGAGIGVGHRRASDRNPSTGTGQAPPQAQQDAARMSATDRRHCRIDDRPHGCARYFPHRRKDDPA